ncbi:MAG TPA: hypothetical protein VGB82_28160 [Alphaproteobacteria bacterium]
MILEFLEWLATPCPADLRKLGYRTELIAIGARHRRCRAAWADHLARSRRAIETAINRAAARRTAIVLGSGRLLDVPLARLAKTFQRVVLVDAVHSLPARLQAMRHPNVDLCAADVTGVLAELRRLKPGDGLPPARSFAPIHAADVDLVVSLNLLSQLGVLPVEWIERRLGPGAETKAEAFAAALTRAHLDDLGRCRATVCLIADVEWRHVGPNGEIRERASSIHGVAPPTPAEDWIWPIAPAPEIDPLISEHRRVIVAYDPGKSRAIPGD